MEAPTPPHMGTGLTLEGGGSVKFLILVGVRGDMGLKSQKFGVYWSFIIKPDKFSGGRGVLKRVRADPPLHISDTIIYRLCMYI